MGLYFLTLLPIFPPKVSAKVSYTTVKEPDCFITQLCFSKKER